MRSSLDGERMMLPEMESRQPTLVPPSPYSIAPLGYDVRPAAPAAKRSVVLGAFGTGALFGGLMMGAVVLAWHAAHPPQESAAAMIAAHPAAPACVPLPALAGVAPATALAADAPAGAATPAPASPSEAAPAGGGTATSAETSAGSKRGKVAPRRVVSHKAKEAKVGGLAASSNDDAFMKAIRASSH